MGGGALLYHFFIKLAILRKACGKDAESLAESLKPLIFKDFMHFIPHISLMQKCIEKTRVWQCKNRARWVGWAGLIGFFRICGNAERNSSSA